MVWLGFGRVGSLEKWQSFLGNCYKIDYPPGKIYLIAKLCLLGIGKGYVVCLDHVDFVDHLFVHYGVTSSL